MGLLQFGEVGWVGLLCEPELPLSLSGQKQFLGERERALACQRGGKEEVLRLYFKNYSLKCNWKFTLRGSNSHVAVCVCMAHTVSGFFFSCLEEKKFCAYRDSPLS